MNIEQTYDYLHAALSRGSVLGLETMERLTAALGRPQDKLRFIHVAGTNGKGSISTMIASMLRCAGYRVGTYNSPALTREIEQISIDCEEIDPNSFARAISKVAQAAASLQAQGHPAPTSFEIMTSAAFVAFEAAGCDLVVLEVGLGGREDATNVISCPEIAVITAIDLDHTAILGDTLAKIAWQKGGIIKPRTDVVLYQQSEEVTSVIEQICEEQHACLHKTDFSALRSLSYSLDGQEFDLGDGLRRRLSLLGTHQLKNAATAVKVVQVLREKGWNISEEAIDQGLRRVRWPARFEVLRKDGPVIILDGAHNPQGICSVCENLRVLFPEKKITFVMGVLADKDYTSMLDMLLPLAKEFFLSTPPNPRALPAADFKKLLDSLGTRARAFDQVEQALDAALSGAQSEDVLCICGSLYQAGRVRSYFNN
jgi:dihydrofolate synthase/folylpolyglutamate synthase